MRRPVIAGNWKMHKTIAEAVSTVEDLARRISGVDYCDVVVAPPFTALEAVARAASGTSIRVSAQDIAAEQGTGAFTGEVSGAMLVDAGASLCIVGHSERRHFYGEADDVVRRKLEAALAVGLTPIVCVGEQLEERDAGRAKEVVEGQIRATYGGLTASEVSRTIAAYEPVWAIGTGRTATPETAQEMHHVIRMIVADLVGPEVAEGVRILYGGSVKPDNISELMQEPDVDGGLVGGASLDAESFAGIVGYR